MALVRFAALIVQVPQRFASITSSKGFRDNVRCRQSGSYLVCQPDLRCQLGRALLGMPYFERDECLGLRRSWSSELIRDGGQRRLEFVRKPRTRRID